ncbi:MAG: VRR-NUC domain-containing protein [Gammaproteobacteria bacterium]|nr:VRR-NUC domain-containing protein [Gammaproteobacteria bacterium]
MKSAISEYQALQCKFMTEKTLRDKYIVPCAELYGLHVYFTWRSDHSPAGYLDLTIVGRGEVFWAELKREGQELTDGQKECRRLLLEAGQRVYVWFPHSWFNGEIERILSGKE